MGIPIRGGDELLPELVKEEANCFVVAVGATGDNQPCKYLYELALSYDLEPLTVIHPNLRSCLEDFQCALTLLRAQTSILFYV